MSKVIAWLKNDLRVQDNPLFIYAAKEKKEVLPVFIWSPNEERTGSEDFKPGGASKLWLEHSLKELKEDLPNLILIKAENSLTALKQLIDQTKVEEVIWNFRFEPYFRLRDKEVKEELENNGLKAKVFNGNCLFDPSLIKNKSSGVFKVFTPFYKHSLTLIEEKVEAQEDLQLSSNLKLKLLDHDIKSDDLALLEPQAKWNQAWQEMMTADNIHFTPGEKSALKKLADFLPIADDYDKQRDFPALQHTSMLSQHLHFGEISPHRIWKDAKAFAPFRRQVIWREFAHYILYHFDYSAESNFSKKFDGFPWMEDPEALKAWQEGKTGYPIVDAGMRELWQTGIMHNRVRMIVGSFLVKHLMQHWLHGARWFWDTLFDANLANNAMGWQWVAGSGVDASPYFRIFNPIIQGAIFDPDGSYIKKWVPELAKLDKKWLNKPFEAPAGVLLAAGVELGVNYPKPLVLHSEARDRAMAAFKSLKS